MDEPESDIADSKMARLSNVAESEHDLVLKRWAALCAMDRIDLRGEWINAFGRTPPKFLSLVFMRKALIWQAQSELIGGLKTATQKQLGSYLAGKKVAKLQISISPGTQLISEWNGRRYLVNVTDNGFELDGQTYKSLTAIAHKITGAKWSGPRFFGLNSKSRSF